MAVTTYRGTVRSGKIEPITPVDLPEGSEVYVVVPADISLHIAHRKANAWLIGMVGNMLLADNGALVEVGQNWVWRFDVFVTSTVQEPRGPIGVVDIDASTGDVLASEETKTALYEHGRTDRRPV